MSKELSYRSDIDGLRAIAVASVVTFHAFPQVLTGGFVGVDVFFVISGFLITSLIVKKSEAGRFSIIDFYERRARRILPALVVVVLATLAAGSFILFPFEFRELARSAGATALFASNAWFYIRVSDYFADAAEYAPLLHTWSLAVEEQFYIVAPILLMLALRGGRRTALAVMALVSASSLALSIYVSADNAGFAFYLPFTRAYELGLGSMLALVPASRMVLEGAKREVLAGAGLVMILAAIALFDDTTVFPGYAALLPCLGAAFLIAAGRSGPSLAANLLSLRPVVFVGLISYSWYLWHWPVLALIRVRLDVVELPAIWAAAAVVSSFALAVLSWRFVEQPFRRPGAKALLPTRRGAFAASAATLGVVMATAGALELTGGVPQRFSPEVNSALSAMRVLRGGYPTDCQPGVITGSEVCRALTATSAAPLDVLIYGDSHAGKLALGLVPALSEAGLTAEVEWMSNCPPLVDAIPKVTDGKGPACIRQNRHLLERLHQEPNISVVVLQARWALYAEGIRVPLEPEGPVRLISVGEQNQHPPQSNLMLLTDGITAMVGAIRETGRKVVLVGSVPEIGWNVPRSLARSHAFGYTIPPVPHATLYAPNRRGRGDVVLQQIAASDPGVTYVSVTDIMCDPACAVLAGAKPLYVDDDHLSIFGAALLVERLGLAARIAEHASPSRSIADGELSEPSAPVLPLSPPLQHVAAR